MKRIDEQLKVTTIDKSCCHLNHTQASVILHDHSHDTYAA